MSYMCHPSHLKVFIMIWNGDTNKKRGLQSSPKPEILALRHIIFDW